MPFTLLCSPLSLFPNPLPPSDSRVSRALEDPDFSNLLGAVLDTVSESTQADKGAAGAAGGLSAGARKGLANMMNGAQHGSMMAARSGAA